MQYSSELCFHPEVGVRMLIRFLFRKSALSEREISQGYSALRQLGDLNHTLEGIESRRKHASNALIARNCPFRVGDIVEHTTTGDQ